MDETYPTDGASRAATGRSFPAPRRGIALHTPIGTEAHRLGGPAPLVNGLSPGARMRAMNKERRLQNSHILC